MLKLLIIASFISQLAFANSQIERATIVRTIKALSPNLEHNLAVSYGKIIEERSKVLGIDWKIPVAIMMQESSFNVKAINTTSWDYGIGQINYRTAYSLNLDVHKLLSDYSYSINAVFKVLKDLKRGYGKENDWYTRYHSYTLKRRLIYSKLLGKHFEVIHEVVNDKGRQEFRTSEKTYVSGLLQRNAPTANSRKVWYIGAYSTTEQRKRRMGFKKG